MEPKSYTYQNFGREQIMAHEGLRIYSEASQTPVTIDQETLPQAETAMVPDSFKPPMLPEMGEGIVDQSVARYLGPESRCQGCLYFVEGGSCRVVSGEIDPQGVCSLFTAGAGEDMLMGSEEDEAGILDAIAAADNEDVDGQPDQVS